MIRRILTLFGEEIITVEDAPVEKKRVKKAQLTETEADITEPKDSEQVAIPERPPRKKRASSKKEKVSAPDEKNDKENEQADVPKWETGEKKYYSIGEVAGIFKIKTSNIRFWTIEFGIKVRTTRKGDRLYTPEQIRELRTIYHLVKERGFTLAGAKAKMKGRNKQEAETMDLKQSLQQLRNKLLAIRNRI